MTYFFSDNKKTTTTIWVTSLTVQEEQEKEVMVQSVRSIHHERHECDGTDGIWRISVQISDGVQLKGYIMNNR